jgi:hypothetical protein
VEPRLEGLVGRRAAVLRARAAPNAQLEMIGGPKGTALVTHLRYRIVR